jgi:hypothetical protein
MNLETYAGLALAVVSFGLVVVARVQASRLL